jgi:hypothetical protein
MAQNIEREIREQISQLPSDQQRRVLDFARLIAAEAGNGSSTGQALLAYAGTIADDDLAAIRQAIDKDCETINSDEW